MPRIRLGIVGCGAVADFLHSPAIQKSGLCVLSACVDSDLKQAEQLAAKYGVEKVATNLSDIAAEVDAVVLAVPPHVRPVLAIEAMQLGLDVVCEKPLANSVQECLQIADCADTCHRVVAVFHQYRFWPARIRIKEMLLLGELTRPIEFEFQVGQPYSWASLTGYTVLKQLVPGGVAINAGIHPMDTLIWWFGDPVTFEYRDDSCGGIESNVRLFVEFEDGVSGHLRLSRTCNLSNECILKSEHLKIVLKNNDPFTYVSHKNGGSAEVKSLGSADIGYLAPAANLYDDFASAISNHRRPMVDSIEATRVIKWIEECYVQKKDRQLPSLAPLPGLTW